VNWSPAEVAEVPPAVVTVTSTTPALPAGEVTVTDVALLAVIEPAVAPNVTEVAEVRLVPVMTTLVPPAVGPLLGVTEVTVGAPAKVNRSPAEVADVPPAVVTVMSTAPALPTGEVTVTDVAVLTVIEPAVAPNLTEVAEDRLIPVMTTLVLPAVGPLLGVMEVTVGAPMKVNLSPAEVADVPPVVVTVTSTTPALPAGAVAVTDVAVLAVIDAVVAPNLTELAEDRFVPVMTTLVPPACCPDVGEMEVTVGAAT